MLKLNNTSRGWVAIACALWVIVLVALIFIPLTKPSPMAAATPTNSLSRSLEEVKPGGEAVAGQLIDLTRVYDKDYIGFTTLCPNEPDQLLLSKLQALNLDQDRFDFSGDWGYMLLFQEDQNAEIDLDKVELSKVNICSIPQSEMYPMNTPLPFHKDGNGWVMGVAA